MKPIHSRPKRWQAAMSSPPAPRSGGHGVAPGGRLVAIAQPARWHDRPARVSTPALASVGHPPQARRQAQLFPLGCALRIASFQAGQATLACSLWDCMGWLGSGWEDVARAAAIAAPA